MDAIQTSLSIRGLSITGSETRRIFHSAFWSGFWDNGSVSAPLVSGSLIELEKSGMIFSHSWGDADPGQATIDLQTLARGDYSMLSRFYAADGHLISSAFVTRSKCEHCEVKWSTIVLNTRLLWLQQYIVSLLIDPKSSVKPILPLIDGLSADLDDDVNAILSDYIQSTDEMTMTAGVVFLMMHEQSHIGWPSVVEDRFKRANMKSFDLAGMDEEQIELACDKNAFMTMLEVSYRTSKQQVNVDHAWNALLGTIAILLALRFLAQRRSKKDFPPSGDSHPSIDKRIGVILEAWKEFTKLTGMEELGAKAETLILNRFADLTMNLQKEIVDV